MNDRKIDISVVIPAHNEEKFITDSLKSLCNQSFKGNYELVVVDNNSTDTTAKIAKQYGARVIFEPELGISRARQTGFDNAKGEIIASTDADTIVPNNWLEKIYQTFLKKPEAVGLAGFYELYGANSIKTAFINLFLPIVKNISWLVAKKGYFLGSNFAIKKSIFQKIGGFNPKIIWGEDVDLGIRAAKEGKIVLKYNLKVITSARRYENLKIWELFKLNILSFLYLVFLNRPYTLYFKHIRTNHNPKITVNKLKIISQIIGLILLFLCFTSIIVYAITQPKSQLMGKTYWHEKTKEKVIALTFDDGPNEPYTSEILSILDQNQIKATFFELGKNIEYYPEVTKKLYDDGQVIGNHSYSHLMDLSIEDKKTMMDEVVKTQNIIFQTIGVYPHLFRPPHGYKTPFLLKDLEKNNLIPIEWSDMTNDYYSPGIDKIVSKIMKKAKPGGIIVMHDGDRTKHGSDRSETVTALKEIITKLKNQGYKFVTVPELLNIQAYNR